jgi:hypothetical protein
LWRRDLGAWAVEIRRLAHALVCVLHRGLLRSLSFGFRAVWATVASGKYSWAAVLSPRSQKRRTLQDQRAWWRLVVESAVECLTELLRRRRNSRRRRREACRPDADPEGFSVPDSRGSASPRRGSKGIRGPRGSQSPMRVLPGGDPRDSSGNPQRKGGCPGGAGGGRLPERCPEAAAEPVDAEQMLETSAGACTRLFKIGYSG